MKCYEERRIIRRFAMVSRFNQFNHDRFTVIFPMSNSESRGIEDARLCAVYR
jgi:predicted GH43/DUF377 family glycosyl hydrolase